MAVSLQRTCRCTHARDAHEHYRRGSDCARCECSAYQGSFVVTMSLRAPSPRPVVVVPDLVEQAAGHYVRPTHSAGTGGRPAAAVAQVAVPRDRHEARVEDVAAVQPA